MDKSLLQTTQELFAINFFRYFFIATPAFLVFYIFFKKQWNYKKIQQAFPKSSDYWREISYSLLTILIFVGVALVAFVSPLKQFHLQYYALSEKGTLYFVVSILLMILLHDTYFYWIHRAMHHPKLFNYFHLVHHKSTNPSPWAAYAFHPLEAVIEASVIFPIIYLIPFHKVAILIFLVFMMAYNVYGHLGYELYPKGFNKTSIGKWINTSVNHNQHHKHFTGNYGLYFLFWDRWLGTVREDYDSNFAMVDEKRNSKNN